ncbi:sulfotransferase family protein [Desulfoprunum sp.]|uniref:sulfotransferase family protein n=1 Tax=Desulfoprunum sp. TaxID=2020866 RepID=UPI003C76663F
MTENTNSLKIFGIGLNKTGTTTLGRCGKILGYRYTECDRGLLEDVVLRNDFARIGQTVERFDLFEDWPWPLIYKDLDRMYPGSRFILTIRKNENVWLDSLKSHSLRTPPLQHCRKLAYGYNFPHGHEQEHLELYRRHNDNVRAYFKDRDRDFLEICWENGDGFEKLCNFLGREVPAVPLPHANKKSDHPNRLWRFLSNRLLSLVGN